MRMSTRNNEQDWQIFRNEVCCILTEDGNLSDDDNLLSKGLSSIQIMKLMNVAKKIGYRLTFEQLLRTPFLRDWQQYFLNTKQSNDKASIVEVDMSKPFELTEVQHAYWVGRYDGQYLGNVGCHGYLEVNVNHIDVNRLGDCWKKLQQVHPMLRSVFTNEGKQYINPVDSIRPLIVHNYVLASEKEVAYHLENMRDQLSHRLLDIENGQVAELQLSLLPNHKGRLFFDIDLLVADVQSYQIILRDLVALYNRGEQPKAPSDWNFATYLATKKQEKKQDFEKAKNYWQARLATLPSKPQLPVQNKQHIQNRFQRRSHFLNKEQWENLQKVAVEAGVTPAMVFLTVYSLVINKWSENSHFLINIPLFNRDSEEIDIENVVADFTTLLLLEVDMKEKRSFIEEVQLVQKQFHQDMKHTAYSGVNVQRDYIRIHPEERQIAPVVFSCNLGVPLMNKEFIDVFGDIHYMISQTPQVWLDLQVFEKDEGVLLIWDGVEEVFKDGTLDEMFTMFSKAIACVAGNMLEDWRNELLLSIDHQEAKWFMHRTSMEIEETCLHTKFFQIARNRPDAIALTTAYDGRSITYGELAKEALRVAQHLMDCKVEPGRTVGLMMKRGMEQIAAILGIVAAGCVYVPISGKQPVSRREKIYESASIQYVITDDLELEFPANITGISYDKAMQNGEIDQIATDISAAAYVIFTSGSTGTPKGVEMTHRAAWNTIEAVNRLHNIGASDCVLAVSSAEFDLSVYDIFGLLSVGGQLILIDENEIRDARCWLTYCEQYKVTIWNSVPILFEMLCIEAKAQEKKLQEMKHIFLSGDWIKPDLINEAEIYMASASVTAMGGATEGGIWSNYYQVSTGEAQYLDYIPYGYPLPNQSYRIVNERGENCPIQVAGELWIGGQSLATGYIGDLERTRQRFITMNGEKWYRTGDYGKYNEQGIIEFLGRKDDQVKISGHRIEIGEIERNMKLLDGVRDVVVLTIQGAQDKALHAYITLNEENSLCDIEFAKWVPLSTQFINESVLEEADKTPCNHKYMKRLHELTRYGISTILEAIGFSLEKGATYNLTEEMKRVHIESAFWPLIKKWYEFLEVEGIVSEIQDGAYENKMNFPIGYVSAGDDSQMEQFVHQFVQFGPALLRGEVEVSQLLLNDSFLLPNTVIKEEPGAVLCQNKTIHTLKDFISTNPKNCLNILEIGARDVAFTKEIIHTLDDMGMDYRYTVTDESPYFQKEFGNLFHDSLKVDFQVLHPLKDPLLQGYNRGMYDIILSNNALHRVTNLPKALAYIQQLLNAEGLFILLENTMNHDLQLITTALLEKGFTQFQDCRETAGQPLLADHQWKKLLREANYADLHMIEDELLYTYRIFLARGREVMHRFNQDKFERQLSEYLPNYMIPKRVTILNEMPITENGKLNRKLLQSGAEHLGNNSVIHERDMTLQELQIAELWKELLHQEEIHLVDNFYQLGGDSLIATQLHTRLQKMFNRSIPLETIFKYPKFEDFVAYVESQIINEQQVLHDDSMELPIIEHDRAHLYEPFPLTDIQQSYWLGRSGVYELSDVSAHCYFELECGPLDMMRITDAWNQLIQRHDMMRAILLEDGLSQRILSNVSDYSIEVIDYRFIEEEPQKGMNETRKHMAHTQFDVTQWPLFKIAASVVHDNRVVLHISFDNTVFDGYSIFKLFDEWYQLYHMPNKELPSVNISFRDYALALTSLKGSSRYERDYLYWQEKVNSLPSAPELPIIQRPNEIQVQKFTRYQFNLDKEAWATIKQVAHQINVTPSVVVMTAYAEILAHYSRSSHFTLNLTHFNRLPLHQDVNELVGDFTSLVLIEFDHRERISFMERCQKTQQRLLRDLEHSLVSGVEVERMLKKARPQDGDITMPVVFTSGIGIYRNNLENIQYLGTVAYGASQTPQVWIDHQIFEQEDELILCWDGIAELFPSGLLQDMFTAYTKLLHCLGKGIVNWQKRDSLVQITDYEQRKVIHEQSIVPRTEETLVSLLTKSMRIYYDNAAIITPIRTITYGELSQMTQRMIPVLQKFSSRVIPIVMHKGWEQLVAAAAIMQSGCAYLPIEADTPRERILQIFEQTKPACFITTEALRNSLYFEGVETLVFEELMLIDKYGNIPMTPSVKPDDLAYIIFTSGSTGRPKGVEITHRNVVNTILDMNKRFNLTAKDRSIGLSNFNFDLSVYDSFGLFVVGGSVVIPDLKRAKDPEHWLDLLLTYKVTIWNTVPAFMDMLIKYHRTVEIIERNTHNVRLVMMSGDWIPLELPTHIVQMFGDIQVVSLGGATEASIWSNFYCIEEVKKEWKSIPYGKSLSHQQLFVLNDRLEECPIGVKGNLFIGGIGVSPGYHNDQQRTEQSFLQHSKTGERIYRTGDVARVMPDGNIEFLGREDSQVKMNGYRIELGDVEANLTNIANIQQAVVTVQENQLIAHLKLDECNEKQIEESNVMEAVPVMKEQVIETINVSMNHMLTDYTEAIEWLSIEAMLQDLYKLQVFTESGQVMAQEDILAAVEPSYHSLIMHWLERLTMANILKQEGRQYQILYDIHAGENYIREQRNRLRTEKFEGILVQLERDIANSQDGRIAILKGEKKAIEYLLEPGVFLTPDNLGRYNVTSDFVATAVEEVLKTLIACNKSRKWDVLELGTRVGNHTDRFASVFEGLGTYTYSDESTDHLKRKAIEINYQHVKYQQFDMNMPPDNQGLMLHSYDLIIADNTLHRGRDLRETLTYVERLLKTDGLLLTIESTVNRTLLLITVALFEEGYNQLSDFRKVNKLPLISCSEWQQLYQEVGLTPLFAEPDHIFAWPGESIMVSKRENKRTVVDIEVIQEQVMHALPKYMWPTHYIIHHDFPITNNGKINRKYFEKYRVHKVPNKKKGRQAESVQEQIVAQVWESILETTCPAMTDNFFESGGDSLKAIRLINELDQAGYIVSLQQLFEHPTVEQLAKQIVEKNENMSDDFEIIGSL